jgi:hypothetical protein
MSAMALRTFAHVLNRQFLVSAWAIFAFLVGRLAPHPIGREARRESDSLPESDGVGDFNRLYPPRCAAGKQSAFLRSENLFEKFDGNILPPPDLMPLEQFAIVLLRQLDQRAQGIFAFLRESHRQL